MFALTKVTTVDFFIILQDEVAFLPSTQILALGVQYIILITTLST